MDAHSWRLYSAALLGTQAAGTLTQYLTQSHYIDTELTSACPTLLMLGAMIGSDTVQLYKSLV